MSLTRDEVAIQQAALCPHAPNQPCTCDGNCSDDNCEGEQMGCTCDIDFHGMTQLLKSVYAQHGFPDE